MARLLELFALCMALGAIYTSGFVFYNLFLHPLRKYPGPFVLRATRLGYLYKLVTGTLPFDLLGLHQRYGEIVRIAPDELAFANPQAWKDIMGHRSAGDAEFDKYMKFYKVIDDAPSDIVNADREEHTRLRRPLAHGFSDRSMRDQQPIIKSYIDLFITRLREKCDKGATALNMSAWYNFLTFDIIGDLAFGEAFGCLDNSDYHPWVRTIFQLARGGTILQATNHFPAVKRLLMSMVPRRIIEEHEKHEEMTKLKLLRRMESGKERPDLIEGLLKKKDDWGLTMGKLQANAGILIIGGSETTATLLSGVTFLLLTNPDALRKLTEEVRSAFKSEDEIDFVSVSNLTYMLACLDEALRMYPPVPTGLPRVVPKGGAVVCGNHIPENTIVAVHQWALYHNEKYWTAPFEFHPERFLGDPRFEADNRDTFQPFHLGPRACLGRNLAYVEMRLILARVVWNFDMRISDDSLDWMDKQRIYNLWEKGVLDVFLSPIRD